MSQLYPLKFHPILKDKIWGGNRLKNSLHKSGASEICGESWEIADVQEEISVVSNGFLAGNNLNELIEIYLGDLVGDSVYEAFGEKFPLLIKFIDANDKLSIQVHPDDTMAQEYHNCPGKAEMWYIIDHEPESELIVGFNQKVDDKIYLDHLNNNSLPEILNFEKVKKGDVFYLPPGRIHAIGAGILLTEIQQSSDITYRIFDWNRTDDKGNPRELHTDMALKAMDFNFYNTYKSKYETRLNHTTNMVDCPYFFTNVLYFDKPVEKDYNLIDSFVIYIAVDGNFIIKPEGGENVEVVKGESILLPAIIKNLVLEPKGLAQILEVYIK
jgi:mannose-6-phosphate isomerase